MLSSAIRRAVAILVTAAVVLSACISDSSGNAVVPSSSTAAAPASPDSPRSAPPATDAPATDAPTTDPPTTDPPTTEAPTTSVAPAPLEVLVTNDDGYAAAGIDAVVEYLRTRPDVHVTVVAPASEPEWLG